MNQAKETIQRYFRCMAGEEDTPITDFFADNIRWHLPPAHPYGGPFEGIPAVLEMMARGNELFLFDTIVFDHHALIAEGEDVVAHFGLSARTPGGSDYRNEYLFRFRCAKGKIAEVWEFMDSYLQYQMGMFD